MKIIVPDIGVDQAEVAEILVTVGQQLDVEDGVVLLESDKAAVEVPSTAAGVVKNILVQVGDEVTQGALLIELEASTEEDSASSSATKSDAENKVDVDKPAATEPDKQTEDSSAKHSSKDKVGSIQIVTVPDLGVDDAEVVELLVAVGDQVEQEQSICTVESSKASVEVPAPFVGEVVEILVQVGDQVKQGSAIISLQTKMPAEQDSESQNTEDQAESSVKNKDGNDAKLAQAKDSKNRNAKAESSTNSAQSTPTLSSQQLQRNANVYAGPAVRQLARKLGVPLAEVKSSGDHGRILKDDVYQYVNQRLNQDSAQTSGATAPSALGSLPALPSFDGYGGVEQVELTRLQQVSIPQLSLNCLIPQVTQFAQADITELEAWRQQIKGEFKAKGISLTILAFIIKATAKLLKDEPYFASHLSDDQKSVLLRKEIHIGIAVATERGLTVPVLRHPDQSSIAQIAGQLAELSEKARNNKLTPKELQGACFTVSSLGTMGGTAFTPLVNWPQVAILGLSATTMQPVWDGKAFQPRLMLPMSLSYDHRVINGADAARFSYKLAELIKDIRQLLL